MWADEDDEKVEVNIAGRDRLRKLRQTEDDASISGTPKISFLHSLAFCYLPASQSHRRMPCSKFLCKANPDVHLRRQGV